MTATDKPYFIRDTCLPTRTLLTRFMVNECIAHPRMKGRGGGGGGGGRERGAANMPAISGARNLLCVHRTHRRRYI